MIARKSGLLLAFLAAACTHTGGLEPGGHYVATGSSFAAGAGIGPVKPDTPERCQRTALNYASILARELSLDLSDQGCGGAVTEHLLAPWNELPAQLDAVTPQTQLVTVTVGGNDLNYIGNLFMAGCDPAVGMRTPDRTIPCQPIQLPADEDYASVEQQLIRVGEEVRRRAPGATLVFVQYVTLVPEEICPAIGLSEDVAQEFRTLGLRLADATRKAADATGAKVLHADRLSETHTACDSDPWSKAAPTAGDTIPGAPWHPNAAGHAAIAQELVQMLGR